MAEFHTLQAILHCSGLLCYAGRSFYRQAFMRAHTQTQTHIHHDKFWTQIVQL